MWWRWQGKILFICILCVVYVRVTCVASSTRSPPPSSALPALRKSPTAASPSAGSKGKSGTRSRSKSPFRSFRWKKSSSKNQLATGSDGGAAAASDEEVSTYDDEGCISLLIRKSNRCTGPYYTITTTTITINCFSISVSASRVNGIDVVSSSPCYSFILTLLSLLRVGCHFLLLAGLMGVPLSALVVFHLLFKFFLFFPSLVSADLTNTAVAIAPAVFAFWQSVAVPQLAQMTLSRPRWTANTSGNRLPKKPQIAPGTKSTPFCAMENWPFSK